VEIGKSSTIQPQDLTKLYAQRSEADGAQGTGGAEGVAEGTSSRGNATGAAAPVMVEISAEARARAEQQESLQLARELYDRLPAVRSEVVAAVKARLAAGYYDSDEVKDALADRLTGLVRRLDLAVR
jgi:hypothetical protein